MNSSLVAITYITVNPRVIYSNVMGLVNQKVDEDVRVAVCSALSPCTWPPPFSF